MSRSYKKHPFVKDNDMSYWGKKLSNKKIRNTSIVGNGSNYKKHYDSWNIHDYCSRCSLQEYLHNVPKEKRFVAKNKWERDYLRK